MCVCVCVFIVVLHYINITLSCLVLSCLVLSCLVLSCLVLSCLVSSCGILNYIAAIDLLAFVLPIISSLFNLNIFFSLFSILFSRSSLCNALVKCSNIVDESETLLNTLISSLLSTFSTYEVTSSTSEQNCSLALQRISSLTAKGLLTRYSSQVLLADLVSSYTILSEDAGYKKLFLNSRYPVYEAVRQYFLILFCYVLFYYFLIFYLQCLSPIFYIIT